MPLAVLRDDATTEYSAGSGVQHHYAAEHHERPRVNSTTPYFGRAMIPMALATQIFTAADLQLGTELFHQTIDTLPHATPLRANIGDTVIKKVGRVKSGWAGPGTIAPPPEILSDLERVVGYLPPHMKEPSLEIDEDEGHVRLSWMDGMGQRMFSLVFKGGGDVIGSYASLIPGETQRPWKYRVTDENKIAVAIEASNVRNLIVA